MTTNRIRSEKDILISTLFQYNQQKIFRIIEASPILKNRLRSDLIKPFEKLLFSTLKQITTSYPKQSYVQLQKTIEQRQLPHTEKQTIKRELNQINQKLVDQNKRLNKNKKIWYKIDRNAFLKQPFKRKKPDKKRYRSLIFIEQDSPFNLKNSYNILALAFEALAKEHKQQTFSRKKYLPQDIQNQAQHKILDKTTDRLTKINQATEDKDFIIKSKEAQLKRELEQLANLTKLVRAYDNMPSDTDLTSPNQRLDELEALLQSKRR